MDQPRGRSPSAGQRTHISRQPSPSPHGAFQNNSIAGLGFDPALSSNSPANFAVSTAGFDNAQFLATSQAQQFPHQTSLDQGFLQASQSLSQHNTPHFGPQGSTLQPDALDLTGSANNSNPDFSNFFANNDIGQTQQVPQYLGATLDPQLLDSQPQQHQAVNPNDLMNQMATTQAHSPTPPHLLPTMNNHQSPSPHASPNMNQGGFPSPGHSRHASLDPNAAFGTGQGSEWGNMASFRGHRRAPSETFSDVSSAHASPYLIQQDSFEDTQPSPMLNPQADPQLFHDPLTQLGQLNFDESRSGISPGHSPGPSPRLPPSQQALPAFQPGNFGLDQGSMNNHFGQPGMMSYSNSGPEPFPVLNHPIGDIGQADAMSPPEINIDFAPPSRQPSFEPSKPEHQADALSPPDRSRSRNRMRAKSDPFSGASSRASTPGSEINRSLSPSAAKSRSPSPSKSSRRSSTSSMPNRDYILDLADPTRPAPADGSNPKRTQKHPATFHCTLCTKRFTRAYNLRSHLRTHTDERPFVCSVCGKAFARQHDRKRHEGLHSGEKKFVCRGNLKDGNNWGCGRRFARADALGRHFRSEAGRVCIRPLLEEEAAEKGNWDGQNQQMNNGNGMFGQMSQQNFNGGMMAQQNFEPFPQAGMAQAPHQFLPAAILAQYPALAGLQWDQLPPGPPEEVEGDISGRSSFDASSGGEYYDEEGDNYQNPQQQPIYAGNDGGWASDSGYH